MKYISMILLFLITGCGKHETELKTDKFTVKKVSNTHNVSIIPAHNSYCLIYSTFEDGDRINIMPINAKTGEFITPSILISHKDGKIKAEIEELTGRSINGSDVKNGTSKDLINTEHKQNK